MHAGLASPEARQESQFAVGRDLAKEAAAAHKLAEERTPIPRMADGKPNLSGSWRLSGGGATYSWEEHLGGFGIASEGPTLIIDPADGKLPYQPWALEERERRRRPESAYEENVAKCILPGMPRMMVYNFFIAQSRDKVTIFHGSHPATRIIRFDNRPPLPDNIRLWMGDPRGTWDGDTLVVETTNLNGKGWANLGGDIISDAARIVERFRMINASTMWWEATVDGSEGVHATVDDAFSGAARQAGDTARGERARLRGFLSRGQRRPEASEESSRRGRVAVDSRQRR